MMNKIQTQESTNANSDVTVVMLLTGVVRLDHARWSSLSWPLKWLLMVRAVVLVMTLSSVLVGVCLALDVDQVSWDLLVALVLGLTLAHATNNLLNDWVDHKTGVDKDNYFRRQYGAHALEDGFVTSAQFWSVAVATGGGALVCAGYLLWSLQFDIALINLTLAGALLVLFYTWPLKHFALGELAVLLVWGPLMTAGTYYVLTHSMTLEVLMVSFVVGIGPTLVILGKHMDKYSHDLAAGIRTLPVVIGVQSSARLSKVLLVAQWLVLVGLLSYFNMFAVVLCLFSLPSLLRLVRGLGEMPPAEAPADYPKNVWPLWYTAFAFGYSRSFGIALVLGLILERLIASL